MSEAIGSCLWVIPEGYIPGGEGIHADRALTSHEAACMLNVSALEPDELCICVSTIWTILSRSRWIPIMRALSVPTFRLSCSTHGLTPVQKR